MSEVQRWLRLLEQKNKKDKFLSDTIYQTSEKKKGDRKHYKRI